MFGALAAALPAPGALLAALKDGARRNRILIRGGVGGLGAVALVLAAAGFLGNPTAGAPRVVLSLIDPAHPQAGGHGITGAHEDTGPKSHGLVEESNFGPLPRIASDGRRPSREFSRPGAAPDGRPIVSVLVTGIGRKASETQQAFELLPPDISLAFDAYADNLAALTGQARRKGYEYFIEVPVEPFDFPANDPGPLALSVSAKSADNLTKLKLLMARTTGYAGLTISGRSRFASDPASIEPILAEAHNRGLLIFDPAASPVSKIPKLSRKTRTEWGMADRRLDLRPTDEGIALQLLEIERIALEKGQAIAATDAYPFALTRLANWVQSLEAKGLVLVPISVQMINDSPSGVTGAAHTPQPAPHSATPAAHTTEPPATHESHVEKPQDQPHAPHH